MRDIKPGARSLRRGRYSEPGRIYLVTAVTQAREPHFTDWGFGRLVVDQMRAADTDGGLRSLAFVVMPDHFHWLFELGEQRLDAVVMRVKSRSAKAVNASLRRSGQLWQRGFHDRAIRREDDIRAIARYVIANPLRAGLVQRVGDYPLWDAVWL
ncbi:REP-associated tyrosine transposase [Stutzerimonas stutzeri]|uniref:REP-associated tyrosine transposase n=1 Tax=Stutzerimonas stutzeri TaxID=316 RepID=UPI001C2DF823|nr:transposase [Stutzerimonas stutzeri]